MSRMEAIHVFEQDIMPIRRAIWSSYEVHSAAVSAHLVVNHRILSLVDCVSFEILRHTGVKKVFAFDHHFKNYGFDLNPV